MVRSQHSVSNVKIQGSYFQLSQCLLTSLSVSTSLSMFNPWVIYHYKLFHILHSKQDIINKLLARHKVILKMHLCQPGIGAYSTQHQQILKYTKRCW